MFTALIEALGVKDVQVDEIWDLEGESLRRIQYPHNSSCVEGAYETENAAKSTGLYSCSNTLHQKNKVPMLRKEEPSITIWRNEFSLLNKS